MSIVSLILCLIVALEHLYIMYLETFATSSSKTAKTFNVSPEELNKPMIQTLFKNQGVYNGLFAVGILYALFISANSIEIATMFMIFVTVAAVYGGLTSSKSIILKQGGPAILALISLLIVH